MADFSARSFIREDMNAIARALHGLGSAVFHDLTESNPTRAGLAWDARELASMFEDARVTQYEPDAFGHLEARRALAEQLDHLGFSVPPAQIVLTASTSEAYGYLFKLLCDPGDSVLVPAPSYPLFDMLAQLENVRLLRYPLAYDGEWHVDFGALEQAREQRTRAILVVHPNNPTGSFLKRRELARLAALGLPIISDEVFSEYGHAPDPQRAQSALEACDRALVFRMGGLSKALALPQLKLAWTVVAGPQQSELDEACRRLTHIADSYLSPSMPVQLALAKLLRRAPLVHSRLFARIHTNLAELDQQLERSGGLVTRLRVEGGWYAILRLPALLDEEAWILRFLERDRVLVQPGFFYDLAHGTHAVLSLITPEPVFREGLSRILARVDQET